MSFPSFHSDLWTSTFGQVLPPPVPNNAQTVIYVVLKYADTSEYVEIEVLGSFLNRNRALEFCDENATLKRLELEADLDPRENLYPVPSVYGGVSNSLYDVGYSVDRFAVVETVLY